jgi:hypothetical protein
MVKILKTVPIVYCCRDFIYETDILLAENIFKNSYLLISISDYFIISIAMSFFNALHNGNGNFAWTIVINRWLKQRDVVDLDSAFCCTLERSDFHSYFSISFGCFTSMSANVYCSQFNSVHPFKWIQLFQNNINSKLKCFWFNHRNISIQRLHLVFHDMSISTAYSMIYEMRLLKLCEVTHLIVDFCDDNDESDSDTEEVMRIQQNKHLIDVINSCLNVKAISILNCVSFTDGVVMRCPNIANLLFLRFSWDLRHTYSVAKGVLLLISRTCNQLICFICHGIPSDFLFESTVQLPESALVNLVHNNVHLQKFVVSHVCISDKIFLLMGNQCRNLKSVYIDGESDGIIDLSSTIRLINSCETIDHVDIDITDQFELRYDKSILYFKAWHSNMAVNDMIRLFNKSLRSIYFDNINNVDCCTMKALSEVHVSLTCLGFKNCSFDQMQADNFLSMLNYHCKSIKKLMLDTSFWSLPHIHNSRYPATTRYYEVMEICGLLKQCASVERFSKRIITIVSCNAFYDNHPTWRNVFYTDHPCNFEIESQYFKSDCGYGSDSSLVDLVLARKSDDDLDFVLSGSGRPK